MCRVCGSIFGHKAGCPEANYSDEKIGMCPICRRDITTDDDDYIDYDGEQFHTDCFMDEYRKET